VGANIGWFSLHAARAPGVEMVVAFEADPTNAALLDRSRIENGIDNLVLVPLAVGDRRGLARLHRYKPSNAGRHSLVLDFGLGSIPVPVVDLDGTLDDLGLAEKPIAALKIDVEGCEPAVIAGAQRALRRTQAVVLELAPARFRQAGQSIEAMLATLRSNGFTSFAIASDGSLKPDPTIWTDQDVVCERVWLRDTPNADGLSQGN